MPEEPLDRIHIRDLLLRCVIGVYEWERKEKQDILLNITLYTDLRMACQSDRIEDTVDYKAIKKKIMTMVASSSYALIERLAQRIADICLEHPGVQGVKVSVDKPGALRFARSAAVEIVRERVDHDAG